MRAGKKETASLLGIAGKFIVMVSVHVPVKRNKDGKFPCKSKNLFLGDGKVRGKSALFNMTLTILNTSWRERKDSWRME